MIGNAKVTGMDNVAELWMFFEKLAERLGVKKVNANFNWQEKMPKFYFEGKDWKLNAHLHSETHLGLYYEGRKRKLKYAKGVLGEILLKVHEYADWERHESQKPANERVQMTSERCLYKPGDDIKVFQETRKKRWTRAFTRKMEFAETCYKARILERYYTDNNGWKNYGALVLILDGPSAGKQYRIKM